MLSKLVAQYRRTQKLSMRALARRIGVSHGTIYRFEHEKPLDGRTYNLILRWLLSEDK